MMIDFIRDHAMYAVIFGLFGNVWFGWAQENPPRSWRIPLALMSVVCFIIACIGGYLSYIHWGDASALSVPGINQKFGIIVGIEFAAAFIGVGILFWLHKQQFISAWVALVVGIHFWSLVSIFQDEALYLLAILAVSVPIVSVIITKRSGISISTLVGIGMGTLLFIFALRGLFLVMI